MADTLTLLALAGPARPGEPNPLASLVMMGLIFAIFYFVLILPMRRKQKKLEELVKDLKSGRPVVLSSGHLRHHRRRRGRRLPRPRRRQDQDQGPEERRGRPAGALDREDGEVMPPALQNPITLWLLLTAALAGLVYAFMRPELRVTGRSLYGAFLLACAVAMWPPYDAERQARQDPPRPRPARRHPPRAAGGGRRRAQRHHRRRGRRPRATRRRARASSSAPSSASTPTSFRVEGVEPARVKDMRDLLRDFFRDGWEVREPGEGALHRSQMTDLYQRQLKDQTVQEAIRTLERRVNALGVAEPRDRGARQPRRPDPGAAARASPTSSRPSA